MIHTKATLGRSRLVLAEEVTVGRFVHYLKVANVAITLQEILSHGWEVEGNRQKKQEWDKGT